MNTRNEKKTILAKGISKTLGVSINMAYKYIRGSSEMTFSQAAKLKNDKVISYEDLENLSEYLKKDEKEVLTA